MSDDWNLAHRFQSHEFTENELPYRSFFKLLASQKSEKIYLKLYDGNTKLTEVSFAQFHRAALYWAKMLSEDGEIQSGQRVGVLLGSRLETYVFYGALMALGAVLVPLNPMDSPSTLATIIEHAEVKVVITVADFLPSLAGLACLKRVVDLAEGLAPSEFDPRNFVEPRCDPRSPAVIFYTSGTTGAPKGVQLSFANLHVNLEGTKRAGEFQSSFTLMTCLPLFHVNAFNFSFLLPLYLGATVVHTGRFVQLGFWSIVRREQVHVLSLVPPILKALVQEQRSIETGELRYVISAASALAKETLQQFQFKFGVPILQAYGLSETVNFTLFTPPDVSGHEDLNLRADSPSAGTPVWGNEVMLLGETGELHDREGELGELVVRGWNIFLGYLNQPEITQECFDGGYFHTGDLGFFRLIGGRRFFYLKGRRREIIKKNGELIYLSEIDAAAVAIGLKQACAVGFNNDFSGEELGLYIVSSDASAAQPDAEILSLLRERLGRAKVPRVIVRGDSLPETSVGKIRRKELVILFAPWRSVLTH